MQNRRLPPVVGADWPVKVDGLTSCDDGSEWVAADESGSTGDDLLAGDQPVLAHSTVRVDDLTATEVLAELRRNAQSEQADEVKFKHFRKGRAAEALAQLLGPGAALEDRVNLSVAYKPYVAAAKVIDLLVEERAHVLGIDIYADGEARKMAQTLFRDGPRGLGDQWNVLLDTFVRMARAKSGEEVDAVAHFFEQIDIARRRCFRRSIDPILQTLSQCRPHAEELVADIRSADGALRASLDPYLALMPDNLRYWYRELGKPFRLLHDEHIVLKPRLVQDTMVTLSTTRPHPALPRAGEAVLELFATGSSHTHPSIQLADLVAGAGRVVVSDFIAGKDSVAPKLVAAVTPLIRWGLLPDDSFWSRRQYFPQQV